MINLTPKQLRTAANIQEKIQSLQAKLNQLLGVSVEPVPREAPRKRKLSAEGLANIRAAQKARWAKVKKTRKRRL